VESDKIIERKFMIRSSFYKSFITILAAGLLCFLQSIEYIHASDCEILETRIYERKQSIIVTKQNVLISSVKEKTEMILQDSLRFLLFKVIQPGQPVSFARYMLLNKFFWCYNK
jgi:hypothetical protein